MLNDKKTLTGPKRMPRFGKPAKQLVILLHGLGADGDDLISLSDALVGDLPDAAFVAPNAPFPCDMAPMGYQWFSLQERTEKTMLEGLKIAAPILDNYIDQILKSMKIPEDKMALLGFSQGTMLALHTALRRKKPCAGVLGYSGALIAPQLLKKEIHSKPPVCLVHGAMDVVVSFAAMDAARESMATNGIDIEVHERPYLGHGIDQEGINIGAEFLKRVLG